MIGIRAGQFLSLAVFLATSAHAVTSRKLQTKTFQVDPHSCSLKRATLAQITFDDPKGMQFESVGASKIEMISAMAETSDPSCLKDYAFVQWIRGCVYTQGYDRALKSSKNYFGYNRENRGKSTSFVHKKWEVDSMKEDPMYYAAPANTVTDPGRFDYYRVPKNKIDFTNEKKALAAFENLVNHSSSYSLTRETKTPFTVHSVKDSPTHASWSENQYDQNLESSTISSLEFQMCLYRTRDVPLTGDPARFDVPETQGGPIVCFSWNAKNRWNRETQKIEAFDAMDPQCGVEAL